MWCVSYIAEVVKLARASQQLVPGPVPPEIEARYPDEPFVTDLSNAPVASRARAKRGLLGAVGGGLAYGAGVGLGGAVIHKLLKDQHIPPEVRHKLTAAAVVALAAAPLMTGAVKDAYLRYVRGED